jgi:hypothetical protein
MPPVNLRFGDFLRALITADSDLVPADRLGYRVAFVEAFGARGIVAEGVRTLSPESLLWQTLGEAAQPRELNKFIRERIDIGWDIAGDRFRAWRNARTNAWLLHEWLSDPANFSPQQATALGLDRTLRTKTEPAGFKLDAQLRPRFEVHSVRPARRVTEDGEIRTDLIAVITQRRTLTLPGGGAATVRGGCTLVLDRREDVPPIRYCVSVPVFGSALAKTAAAGGGAALAARRNPYGDGKEPFALLHRG